MRRIHFHGFYTGELFHPQILIPFVFPLTANFIHLFIHIQRVTGRRVMSPCSLIGKMSMGRKLAPIKSSSSNCFALTIRGTKVGWRWIDRMAPMFTCGTRSYYRGWFSKNTHWFGIEIVMWGGLLFMLSINILLVFPAGDEMCVRGKDKMES